MGMGTVDRWQFSHGTVGVNAPSWLTFEVHRPYFDGADSSLTVIQARAAILAARRFEKRTPGALRFGMTMPASYRRLLVEESRLHRYRASTPAELPEELASPAWRRMTEAYRSHADLDAVDRAGLAHWLIAACLLPAVLDVVPEDLDGAACRDAVTAGLQAARAVALFGLEGLTARTTAAYRPLVEHPAPTVTHVQSVAGWGYLLARHAGDDSAVPHHLDRARGLLADLKGELGDFQRTVLEARLALREVMYAERQQDFAGATARLTAAQQAVGELTAPDADDALVLLETRRRLIDRRLEMAVRLGDTEAEQGALAEGLEIDPSCVKLRMQSAQAHQRAGRPEQALADYLHAARLGPYGTGFALLHAADCAKETGQDEFARVLTERAFRAAPRASATRDRLVASCLEAGDEPLAEVVRQAAVRDPERPYTNNWHYRMHAAYFNLGESRSPGLYAGLPTLAFEFAEQGTPPKVNWQRLMPPAFRTNLIRESGLTEFAVAHPAELPSHLRTPAWDTLCGWVAEFATYGAERRHQVAVVLYRLGFIKLVQELVPFTPAAELRTAAELRMHHWLDVVRWVGSVGRASVVAPANSRAIAEHQACPTHLRFVVAVFSVIYEARETRSLENALAWRETGEKALAELLADPQYSPFEKMMMESRFYRSVSYVPFLQQDAARLAADMDRAEELARAVPAVGEYQEFLRRENLRACVESRSKEFYAFGDNERAHRLVAEALALDPYEPKTHIEVAEGLLKEDRPEEAAHSYLRTARLGPVSTAYGYAAAGDCFARAGQPLLAEDCFLQALRIDPYAISAARGWAAVGPANGMGELAAQYLAGLEAWGAARRAARTA
jgi:tetratricopeptide (TPR) repeat protein